MKKHLVSTALICGMLSVSMLNGCGKKAADATADTTAVQESSEESTEESSAGVEESSAAEETKAADDQTRTEDSASVPVSIDYAYDGDWKDQKTLISSKVAQIHLMDENHKKLQKALDAMNQSSLDDQKAVMDENKEYAEEQYASNPDMEGYTFNRDMIVTRSDETVLSLAVMESSYLGGAHPFGMTTGRTFDTQTGKEFSTSDFGEKWINAVHVDFNTDFLYLIENIAHLEVLNKNNGQCLAVLNQSYCNSLFDTEIFTSKQGNYITSTTRTPNIKIYRTNGWQAVYRILGSWKKENSGIINMIHYSYCKKYDGHQNIIRHVDFSPEEDKVITASADGTAKIWKLPHSEANESIILTPICTLHCVPGLKIQGLKLEKLHSESNLSNEDKSIFKTYGAITDEK